MKKTKFLIKAALISVLVLMVAVGCFIFGAMASEAEPESVALAGDVDGNGFVTVSDLIAMRKYFANYDYSKGEEKTLENGDVNGDGAFNLADLAALRDLFANGNIYEQQVEELGLLELNNGIVLRAREDGSFKVLLISDVQCYNEKGLVNSGTLDVIEAMVESEDPDLVLFVGDNVWSRNSAAELRAYLQVMVKPIEDRKIPWAHIYGNHDAEDNDPWYWAIDKEEQQKVYEEFDYCVSKSGPASVPGVGNYVLPVLAHDSDKIVYNIWALDSMMYRTEALSDIKNTTGATNYFYGKYEGMSEAHTQWYIETSKLLENYNGGEKIPAMMYFHIPLQESYYAWADAVTGGANGATNLVGTKGENISAPVVNCGLFDAIVRRGDVKVIANGHDHENDFSVDYKGVTLAYCGSAGLEAYHNYDIVGARVVNFTSDGEVSTNMSYMNDLPEYNNHNPIINMVIGQNGVTNGATEQGRFELTSNGSNSIEWVDELGRYVVNFAGGSKPGTFTYSAENLTPILYDNFSYEIVFKLDSIGSDYVGILDFAENGGFALNAYPNKDDATGKTFILKAEVSAGHTSGWNADDVVLEIGEWYHVVFSYNYTDYRTRSTAVYVNGMKVAGTDKLYEREKLYRAVNFNGKTPYICIGGCAQSYTTTGDRGFVGSIAICNVLPTSTDANTAFLLSNAFWGDLKEIPPVLDLQINSDGSVVNGAEGRPALDSHDQANSSKVVGFDETIGKNVITFQGHKDTPSTYTLPTSDLGNIFSDGFSYEVMFKVDNTNFSTTYVGILDFEESGGFGLDVYKSSTAGKYTLYAEVSSGVTAGWTQDTIELDIGEWYHLVYVYTSDSTAVYINGVKVKGTDNITEPYRTPVFTSGVSPYICIGGCAQSVASGAGINGMTGSIADVNIFCDPITAEEALELFEASGLAK